MRLLDLFSRGGGASVGYTQAGFQVWGNDIDYCKAYPYTFVVEDAMKLLTDHAFLDLFDVVVASPPCQVYSGTKHLRIAQGKNTDAPDLLAPVRDALTAWGGVYVIENVPQAPMDNPIQVCGSSFGLKVRRHRLFESNLPLVGTECDHEKQGRPVGVYGSMADEIPQGGRTARTIAEAQEAMGIDWMSRWADLKEAIPPAYTYHIGRQLVRYLEMAA